MKNPINKIDMSIQAKEEKLFCKWKSAIMERKSGQFVPDGVVCEKEYSSTNPKIAFILKEVNSPEESDFDLRDFLNEGAQGATWNNICRWVYGIQNRHSMPTWKEFPAVNDENRAKMLRSICAMNLKKTPGGGSADSEELKCFAKRDSDFIQEQYEIYDSDLTICCGTGGIFKEFSGHANKKDEETSRGVSWYERAPKKYVIDYWHPAARMESSLLLYRLIDAVKEIVDKKCPS